MTDGTQRKTADEVAKILRSQGATKEQIKEYQDHAGTAVPTEGATNEGHEVPVDQTPPAEPESTKK